jgi:hypothetical protein
MVRIFEEEKPGIEGEPARFRIFLKLSVLGWVVSFLLWKSGWPTLQMFSAFFVFGAFIASVRTVFHLITLAFAVLPGNKTAVAQVIVAIGAAGLPFTYLFPQEAELTIGILEKAFWGTSSWGFWIILALFVYLTYTVVMSFPKPLMPVRRYLYAVAVVFGIVFLSGHGALSTDEESLSDVPIVDPKSTEGKIGMAASYLRLIILAYGTILYAHIKINSSFHFRPKSTEERING